MRFTHPMKLPPCIKPARVQEILEDVKRGDPAAVNEMIEGHLRYACAIVSKYLLRLDKADDLTGAAFWGVVDGVHSIVRNGLKHDNVTGYLAKRIHGEIRNHLDNAFSVVQNRRGEEQLVDSPLGTHDAGFTEGDTVEIEELLQSLAKDGTDLVILRMLQQGYLPVDIARNLGLHRSNVSRRITRIQEEIKK